MKIWTYILISTLILSVSCSQEEELLTADSDIISYDLGTGINLIGTFRATYAAGSVTVQISLKDQLPGTLKAVHLHDGNCESPGGHWNMGTTANYCEAESNGDIWGKPYAGDVGNVLINSDGTGEFILTTDLWSLGTGQTNDILGKLVIVHAGPTDFLLECDPNHIPDHAHVNSKIGCGTIE